MKYLGNVKVTLLREKQEYKELFSPLSESEYEDLRESIREAGILNDLILEKTEEGYIILSGHHRKAAALELGLEEVPCSLAETRGEILEALFDNASRRQMTEAERKEKVKEKQKVQDRIYEESLIPELYALYKEGKIDRRSVDEFMREDLDLQRSILHSLSVERPVVPQELLEKHEHEIESLEARHNEDLNDLQKKLAEAEAERKEAQEALEQNGKELEEIRKRAKDTLAKYEKNKEQITKQVKKEVEKRIEDLEKERETREAAMKEKQDKIAELNGQIETLNNRIYGYDSQVALWRHEFARVSETYDKSIAYYSNPALIEIQLQVISEFVDSLVRFSGCHKWDANAIKTVEKYRKSIGDLLEKLAEQVNTRQKEVVSVQESEKAIAAQIEMEAASRALAAEEEKETKAAETGGA